MHKDYCILKAYSEECEKVLNITPGSLKLTVSFSVGFSVSFALKQIAEVYSNLF